MINLIYRMTDQSVLVYKGKNMTKAEKEKKKADDAQEAYDKFKDGIQIIERTIMQLNASGDGSPAPICRVSHCKNLDGMMIFAKIRKLFYLINIL